MEKINFVVLPVGSALFKTNCYILFNNSACFVIDPGFTPAVIISKLEELGLVPTHILLTHAHDDHTGGVMALKNRYNALVAVGRDDAYRLKFKPDILLEDNDTVESQGLAVKVVATPGHTEGGVCYIAGEQLFSGDTLFCDDIGRTDLPGGDFDRLLVSLQKLKSLGGDYSVWPGHEESTTLEYERRCNRYMQ